jgi:undecaprenyl-diphosphatase
MTLLKAVILGAVQGLTEFLPVSSSGHLVFFQAIFKMKEPMLSFDIALHAGTLVAVLAYFHKELLSIVADFWKFVTRCFCPCLCVKGDSPLNASRGTSPLLWFYILLTLIPTGIVAVLFKHYFESSRSDLFSIGWHWTVIGTLLILSVKLKEGTVELRSVGWWRSLLIGLAQSVALMPAFSRSGCTILTGMALGIKREDAAKFSFLMSVPAILAAVLMDLKHGSAYFTSHETEVLTGFFVSALTGFLVIKWLMGIIRRGRFSVFGYYCIAIGIVSIVLSRVIR